MPFTVPPYLSFQSTSPPGEDSSHLDHLLFHIIISIHFPTRGRLNSHTKHCLMDNISIHFPTRGRLMFSPCFSLCLWYFNPLPHQGKTPLNRKHLEIRRIFQSTSPPGEDSVYFPSSFTFIAFQSTSPPGEDSNSVVCYSLFIAYFNPLPHQGKTLFILNFTLGSRYFNPLPHQGKTHCNWRSYCASIRFQSTSPPGEDSIFPFVIHLLYSISIHFPTRGRLIYFRGADDPGKIFQSTSPPGEDSRCCP